MKPRLHPRGPHYFNGTYSRGCFVCPRSNLTRDLKAHREVTTGRFHAHCLHCGSIILLPTDSLRYLAKRLATDCAITPLPNTIDWYRWAPGWSSRQQDEQTVWYHSDDPDTYYVLVPDGDQVVRQSASPELVKAIRAHDAMRATLESLAAGQMPSSTDMKLAEGAGLKIRFGPKN